MSSIRNFRGINSDFANPKIQSSYTIPYHFRKLTNRRLFSMKDTYIRFQTFTDENIVIPISASRRQVLIHSHSRRRKVSLMVTSPKRTEISVRKLRKRSVDEERSNKVNCLLLRQLCEASKIERVWAQDTKLLCYHDRNCSLTCFFFICFSISCTKLHTVMYY